jgi:translation initiation factor 4A
LRRRGRTNPTHRKTPLKVSIHLSNQSQHLLVLEEEEFITNWEETVESFDDMGLKEGVLRGIYGHGFVKPSPIQQKGILPVIQSKDTIA